VFLGKGQNAKSSKITEELMCPLSYHLGYPDKRPFKVQSHSKNTVS